MIPGPILQLHATFIADDSVTLVWQPPEEGTITQYVVHYTPIEEAASKVAALFEMDNQINVTKPQAVISGLKSKQLYNFFVLAANEHGTSLPSSILTINITKDGMYSTYDLVMNISCNFIKLKPFIIKKQKQH